jgi:hypothetical protein
MTLTKIHKATTAGLICCLLLCCSQTVGAGDIGDWLQKRKERRRERSGANFTQPDVCRVQDIRMLFEADGGFAVSPVELLIS